MTVAVTVVFVATTALLIVLVLAQRSTGGLSSLFGGSITAEAGSSASTSGNLIRFTAGTALVWALAAVALGLLG